MERGGFNGSQRLSKSSSGTNLDENTERDTACTIREQDRYMPIANVIRIMRKVLPTHAKISDDAKETIQECVSEYISFITSEANERCQREQRKTITAEDVLWAMTKLGFDQYIQPLTVFLQHYREYEGDRGSIRGDPLMKRSLDLPTPLAAAAAAYAPAFHMAHHQGMFGQTMGGANPSHVAMASFDPYAPYK